MLRHIRCYDVLSTKHTLWVADVRYKIDAVAFLFEIFLEDFADARQRIRPFLSEASDLADNVLVGVVQPLVEGDGAVGVGVHGGEVLLTLVQTLLEGKG